jgi:hypothetical protein
MLQGTEEYTYDYREIAVNDADGVDFLPAVSPERPD